MIFSPKLKAKKLIQYHQKNIEAFEAFDDILLLIICAKTCAERTVVEVLNVVSKGSDVDLLNYWMEVEREIQNYKI